MDDLISRQAAIDDTKRFTMDCNPEHFVGHSNFTEYMDTVGIQSFGSWQFANGFNMGLTAAEVAIEKLPSARRKGRWKRINDDIFADLFACSECGKLAPIENFEWWLSDYCPCCGAEMVKGESDVRRDDER